MEPLVVHLIVCDGVRAGNNNLLRANIDGIQLQLRAKGGLTVRHSATVFAVLAGFSGRGVLSIQIVEESSQRRVAAGRRHRVIFPAGEEELVAIKFVLNGCPLPSYGRYRVELLNEDEVLAWKPFWLSPQE